MMLLWILDYVREAMAYWLSIPMNYLLYSFPGHLWLVIRCAWTLACMVGGYMLGMALLGAMFSGLLRMAG